MWNVCGEMLIPDAHFAKLPFLYNLTLRIKRPKVWILSQEEEPSSPDAFFTSRGLKFSAGEVGFLQPSSFPSEAFSV